MSCHCLHLYLHLYLHPTAVALKCFRQQAAAVYALTSLEHSSQAQTLNAMHVRLRMHPQLHELTASWRQGIPSGALMQWALMLY